MFNTCYSSLSDNCTFSLFGLIFARRVSTVPHLFSPQISSMSSNMFFVDLVSSPKGGGGGGGGTAIYGLYRYVPL